MMKTTVYTPPSVSTPQAVSFPATEKNIQPTHLVAHWYKDAEGKLYQRWFEEVIPAEAAHH